MQLCFGECVTHIPSSLHYSHLSFVLFVLYMHAAPMPKNISIVSELFPSMSRQLLCWFWSRHQCHQIRSETCHICVALTIFKFRATPNEFGGKGGVTFGLQVIFGSQALIRSRQAASASFIRKESALGCKKKVFSKRFSIFFIFFEGNLPSSLFHCAWCRRARANCQLPLQ